MLDIGALRAIARDLFRRRTGPRDGADHDRDRAAPGSRRCSARPRSFSAGAPNCSGWSVRGRIGALGYDAVLVKPIMTRALRSTRCAIARNYLS